MNLHDARNIPHSTLVAAVISRLCSAKTPPIQSVTTMSPEETTLSPTASDASPPLSPLSFVSGASEGCTERMLGEAEGAVLPPPIDEAVKEPAKVAEELVTVLQREIERGIKGERTMARDSRCQGTAAGLEVTASHTSLDSIASITSSEGDPSASSLLPQSSVPPSPNSPRLPPRRVAKDLSSRLIHELKATLDPRALALADLYESEAVFVSSLDTFLGVLVPEMRAKAVLPSSTYERFIEKSGVKEIQRLHKEFFYSLTQALQLCGSQGSPADYRETKIGPLFSSAHESWKAAYTRFTVRYWLVREEIQALDSLAWKTFEHRAQTDRRIGRGPLELFFLPIQRIQRYPMVLSEVLARTADEHPDREPLLKAHTEATALAQAIDTAKKEEDARVSTIGAFRSCTGFPTNLVSARRTLIAETDVYERTSEFYLHLFLFSDCLILAQHLPQREKEKKYAFHAAFDLCELTMLPLLPEHPRSPAPQDMLRVSHTIAGVKSGLTILPLKRKPDSAAASPASTPVEKLGSFFRKDKEASKLDSLQNGVGTMTFVWLRSGGVGDLFPERTRAEFENCLMQALAAVERPELISRTGI